MASTGSRILTLIKRYFQIKYLNEEPEPLNFLPDFNPLFTQDLKYDDPCTTPFKVSLDKDTAHDGYYSIKIKFSESLKPPYSPVSIDILHWDLILEKNSIILLIKKLHILNPLASNFKKSYNLIDTSANIQKMIEEAWNRRKFDILEEEEWHEVDLKKWDKEETKRIEEERFIPFEIISLDDDEDNEINNEEKNAEKQLTDENKAGNLINNEDAQKEDTRQLNMEVEIPIDRINTEKNDTENYIMNIVVSKESEINKACAEFINSELQNQLQENSHKGDYRETQSCSMKCFPEWSLYYLKTVIH